VVSEVEPRRGSPFLARLKTKRPPVSYLKQGRFLLKGKGAGISHFYPKNAIFCRFMAIFPEWVPPSTKIGTAFAYRSVKTKKRVPGQGKPPRPGTHNQ
jgi:hypothetical protein